MRNDAVEKRKTLDASLFLHVTLLLTLCCLLPPHLSLAAGQQTDTSERRPAGSGSSRPKYIPLAEFGPEDVGRDTPRDWRELTFDPDNIPIRSRYTVVEKDGEYVLRAHTDRGASALFHPVEADPQEYPYIAWRWRVEQHFPRGDGAAKSGDDYPARLYIAFKYDPSRVGLWTRMKFRMAKGRSDYGEYPPLWALNYVWGNTLKENTWISNPWEERSKMIAVRSGPEGTGEWHWEVRNYLKDFTHIIGGEPTPVHFVAVMIDGDNTESKGTAYFDRIELWSEVPPYAQNTDFPEPQKHGENE